MLLLGETKPYLITYMICNVGYFNALWHFEWLILFVCEIIFKDYCRINVLKQRHSEQHLVLKCKAAYSFKSAVVELNSK